MIGWVVLGIIVILVFIVILGILAALVVPRIIERPDQARVTAAKAGVVVSAQRASDAPSHAVKVRYDGDAQDTSIDLRGEVGAPPCVLLFDPVPPHNRFKQGDVIAARIRELIDPASFPVFRSWIQTLSLVPSASSTYFCSASCEKVRL